MKLKLSFPNKATAGETGSNHAFTLTEMLIAVTVFSFVVAGVITANIFGLKMFQITENKLNASDGARKAIGRLTSEIRSCDSTCVGNVSNGVFTAITDGQPLQGGGLLIYPSTNTNTYIIYFLNSADKTFRRTTSITNSTLIVARSVTNAVLFKAQDYLGNVLTNNQYNRAIYFDLEFYQAKRSGMVADYYKLESVVTRRAL